MSASFFKIACRHKGGVGLADETIDLNLRIADINFSVHTYPDGQLLGAVEPYKADFKQADYDIFLEKTTRTITGSSGKKITDTRMLNWYLAADMKYEYVLYDPSLDCIIVKAYCDIKSKTAGVLFLDVPAVFNTPPGLSVFTALELLLHIIMLYNNGFVIHASSIAYKGRGIAFSALSGTGKSTHTSLWLKNYPGDTLMLNDDKPFLRYIEGEGWYIYGTPWAGSSGINTNLKVPLEALVFLERGETNSMREMSTLEAVTRFFEAVIHPMTDGLTEIILRLLGHLIEESRICILKCNMEDEASETAKKFLFDE